MLKPQSEFLSPLSLRSASPLTTSSQSFFPPPLVVQAKHRNRAIGTLAAELASTCRTSVAAKPTAPEHPARAFLTTKATVRFSTRSTRQVVSPRARMLKSGFHRKLLMGQVIQTVIRVLKCATRVSIGRARICRADLARRFQGSGMEKNSPKKRLVFCT